MVLQALHRDTHSPKTDAIKPHPAVADCPGTTPWHDTSAYPKKGFSADLLFTE